ncbi:MAG: hypothetical protein KGY51_11235 [Psychroflexus sp.]|nr:hypothetical protein [Psychroflexus sp.]
MKRNTQFRINLVDDIQKHYKKYRSRFLFPLDYMIKMFKKYEANHMVCDQDGNIFVAQYHPFKELYGNPYRKRQESNCELSKAMQKVEHEAQVLGWTAEISFKPNK